MLANEIASAGARLSQIIAFEVGNEIIFTNRLVGVVVVVE